MQQRACVWHEILALFTGPNTNSSAFVQDRGSVVSFVHDAMKSGRRLPVHDSSARRVKQCYLRYGSDASHCDHAIGSKHVPKAHFA